MTAAALALTAFRECWRRPFPWIAVLVVLLVTLVSYLFMAFSFGAGADEARNVGISAVFLAGAAVAAFQGTALVGADAERGTLALQLAQPVDLPVYLLGRFLGLAAASLLAAAAVAGGVLLLFALPLRADAGGIVGPALFAGFARSALPIILLDGAAIAASALVPRVFGPILVLGLLLGGNLAADALPGIVLPDFALFGLESGAAPDAALVALYTLVYASFFLLVAFAALAARTPLRGRS